MASGIPVIAAQVTSLPEVTGKAGILVSPDDPLQAAMAIKSVLNGGDRRAVYIERGLQRARQFTWKACAEKTLAVYQEAVHQ
jgi:glycosyltransferase involved in cell wall biosynthesis